MIACLLPSVLSHFEGTAAYAMKFLNSAMTFHSRISLYVPFCGHGCCLLVHSVDVQELKASRHTIARMWVYLSRKAIEGWYKLMKKRKVDWVEICDSEFGGYVFY